jgi:hypothetical protein
VDRIGQQPQAALNTGLDAVDAGVIDVEVDRGGVLDEDGLPVAHNGDLGEARQAHVK